jgi:hypothetical protein
VSAFDDVNRAHPSNSDKAKNLRNLRNLWILFSLRNRYRSPSAVNSTVGSRK